MDWDELHDVKGLATVTKRSTSYVYDAVTCGFTMPGGRATLRMFINWLAKNEDFSRRKAAQVRFSRRRGETGRTGKSDGVVLPRAK